jgi:sec-independent protein translocase protein TatA
MLTLLFLGSIGMTEIIVLALVVLLFFGGKKIPELMKGIGKGVKSFKDGMKDVQDELDLDKETKEINETLNSDKK